MGRSSNLEGTKIPTLTTGLDGTLNAGGGMLTSSRKSSAIIWLIVVVAILSVILVGNAFAQIAGVSGIASALIATCIYCFGQRNTAA
jgi:hypothetical protein